MYLNEYNLSQAKLHLEERIEILPWSGCWIWMLSLTHDYGKAKLLGQTWRAHRLFWEIYKGDIPINLLILHRCDIKCCVNPGHLYLGSQSDNVGDILARQTPNWGRKVGTNTVCKYGHTLEGKNVAWDKKGKRYCMRCSSARSSAAYFNRRAQRNVEQ